MKKIISATLIILFCLSCSNVSKKAEIILTNAKIYTLSWPEPSLDGVPSKNAPFMQNRWHHDAESIAILDGKILGIGKKSKVIKFKGESTKIIDLKGATVLPGFIDSHSHVAELGEILRRVNLIGVQSVEDAIKRAKLFEKQLTEDQWLIGQGWDEGDWASNYPSRYDLDKAFPDRPVVFKSLHGFAVWVNSKALEKIGITEKTNIPVGGKVLKDKSGKLTGIFLNNAKHMIFNAIPEASNREFESYVFDGLKQLSKDGYVSIHQAGASSKHINAFQKLREENRLPIRVYAMLSARDEKLSLEWAKKGPYTDPKGFLDIRSVKAYYDAALGSRGARLLEDYSDKPGHKGISGESYGFNKELVKKLLISGFQVGIHAIGDAGNRETLDYLESVYLKKSNIKSQRNRIEHAQVVDPSDFKRFMELGVIASMEPPHAVEDKKWAEARLGSKRIKNAYAWRTLRRNNVKLTFNSDLPGSDHSIFYGLHSAVTRKDKNLKPENGWYIEQSLSIEEAIRAYTTWSAYASFREKETGVLEIGNWADITVIDIDPFVLAEKEPKKILDGKILMTIVNGKIVYKK